MKHVVIELDGSEDIGEVLSKAFEQLTRKQTQAEKESDKEFAERIQADGHKLADEIYAIGHGVLLPSAILALMECLASAVKQIPDPALRTSTASDVVSLMTAVISGHFDGEEE